VPQTANLAGRIQGINSNVRSVRVYFYSSVTVYDGRTWPPMAPAPMPADAPPEDATATTAHFVVFEGFDRNNAAGTMLTRGSIDSGAQTVQEYAGATGIEQLLDNLFGSG
jgi:hypothetical protein